MENIYRQLQRKLHTLGAGVPSSKDGKIELSYLKDLFPGDYAQFALDLPGGLISVKEAAAATGIDESLAHDRLEWMIRRGTVYRVHDGEIDKYMLVSAYHGFIEFNVYNMDKELCDKFAMHYGSLRKAFFGRDIPIFRYLPIRPELVEDGKCLDTDNVFKLLDKQTKAVATTCMCRKTAELGPKQQRCETNGDNIDVCIMMGEFADFYLEQGWGKEISIEEVKKIIAMADERACILETFNSSTLFALCSCCKCCCGVLNAYKTIDGLGKSKMSNYIKQYDESSCIHCKKCVDRCPSGAIQLINGEINYNASKCLGCGLCVSTCETHASKLIRKEDHQLNIPEAKTFPELYETIELYRKKRGEI